EVFRGLAVPQSTTFHFDLSAQTPAHSPVTPSGGRCSAPAGAATISVEAVLFDDHGNVVFRQLFQAGQTVSVNLFLQPGNYTWRLVSGTANGSPLPATTFTICSLMLNDPVGP